MPEGEYEVELFRKQGFTRQPCARFLDVDNVGKTGQHFTMFEMMAHHAFNFPGKFLYFKDHTVELCHGFLTERLGLKPDVPRYKESWWEGGGNSGPCFEAVFGDALAYLKRATGAKRVDDRVLREYSKVAGMLKIESLADIREIRRQTAERVGISVDELVAQVSPLESLYI